MSIDPSVLALAAPAAARAVRAATRVAEGFADALHRTQDYSSQESSKQESGTQESISAISGGTPGAGAALASETSWLASEGQAERGSLIAEIHRLAAKLQKWLGEVGASPELTVSIAPNGSGVSTLSLNGPGAAEVQDALTQEQVSQLQKLQSLVEELRVGGTAPAARLAHDSPNDSPQILLKISADSTALQF